VLLKTSFFLLLRDSRIDLNNECIQEKGESDPNAALIEYANLSHLAALYGDVETLEEVLRKNPALVHSTCYEFNGKELVNNYEFTPIPSDPEREKRVDQLKGAYPLGNQRVLELIGMPRANTDFREVIKRLPKNVIGRFFDMVAGDWSDDFGFVSLERLANVTPLHLAARMAHLRASQLLLDFGAFSRRQNSNGKTPKDYLTSFRINRMKYRLPALKAAEELGGLLDTREVPRNIPLPKISYELLRSSYRLIYDPSTRQPYYSYQRLDAASYVTNVDRKGISFTVEDEVSSLNRLTTDDYQGSGYHRGHCAEANTARDSLETLRETFKMSNVMPMIPNVNQGVWTTLEKLVEMRARSSDFVDVFTGPAFKPTNEPHSEGVGKLKRLFRGRFLVKVLGKNNPIWVPTHCFKVLFSCHSGVVTGEAYLVPNKVHPPRTSPATFLTTVREIQEITGIIFSEWEKLIGYSH